MRTINHLEGREQRMALVGHAIRDLRIAQGISQYDLADLIQYPQTTISRWENGTVDFTLEDIYALEAVLDVPDGTLSRAGGYTGTDLPLPTVEHMIRHDAKLNSEFREDVITAYHSWVRASEQQRERDAKAAAAVKRATKKARV